MSNNSACKKYSWLGPTTNGGKWYPKNGTLKDFSYQQTNSLDFVLELSCCKYLKTYFLPREWDNNRESLFRFIEYANTGVKGLVLDSKGVKISNATIGVSLDKNYNMMSGKNLTSSESGEYWRLSLPGTYYLHVWHPMHYQEKPQQIKI